MGRFIGSMFDQHRQIRCGAKLGVTLTAFPRRFCRTVCGNLAQLVPHESLLQPKGFRRKRRGLDRILLRLSLFSRFRALDLLTSFLTALHSLTTFLTALFLLFLAERDALFHGCDHDSDVLILSVYNLCVSFGIQLVINYVGCANAYLLLLHHARMNINDEKMIMNLKQSVVADSVVLGLRCTIW